jgi:GNAT superfamily N-acetyltransferase
MASPLDLIVRRVGPDELEPLHRILIACGRALADDFDLHHWDPPHPIERFREDARTREVWSVELDRATVATFTVGLDPVPSYPKEYFAPTGPALYLNRLAVLPAAQRHGLGRECMALVEARARELGCRAVRFDAIAAHEPLLRFYRRLGYRECGPFTLLGLPVIVFEKVI